MKFLIYLALAISPGAGARQKKSPNVLFIVADDLGRDCKTSNINYEASCKKKIGSDFLELKLQF